MKLCTILIVFFTLFYVSKSFLMNLQFFHAFSCMGGAGESDPYSLRHEHWQGFLCVCKTVQWGRLLQRGCMRKMTIFLDWVTQSSWGKNLCIIFHRIRIVQCSSQTLPLQVSGPLTLECWRITWAHLLNTVSWASLPKVSSCTAGVGLRHLHF